MGTHHCKYSIYISIGDLLKNRTKCSHDLMKYGCFQKLEIKIKSASIMHKPILSRVYLSHFVCFLVKEKDGEEINASSHH